MDVTNWECDSTTDKKQELMMSVESLRIYQDARVASEKIYKVVLQWSEFDKKSLGLQIVRAVDSISHNIAEGYGRTSTGERLQFLFYAEASLQEAKSQLRIASDRSLIETELSKDLAFLLRRLSMSIIEFCNALLQRDPTYKGGFRKQVEIRRNWRNPGVSQPEDSEQSLPD